MDKAVQIAEQLVELDPLNFRGYYEKYLITGDEEIREHLRDLMRNARENYFELAVEYGNAGLYSDALKLLEYSINLRDEQMREYPIIHYYLGYYNQRIGNKTEASGHFQTAAEKPHEYVFPFRVETIKALKTALKYHPDDGLALYYIGNIYYDYQPEQAIEAWENAVAKNSNIPVAHRNLAFAYANVKSDMEGTMYNIRRAIQLNPDDPRYYYEHDIYLKSMQVSPKERLKPFITNHEVVTSDLTSLFPYVELLTLTEEFDKAIDLMKTHHFRRWEGGGSIYPYWIYTHLSKAVNVFKNGSPEQAEELLDRSISYPENLQTVSSRFETIVYYFKGLVSAKLDNSDSAVAFFRETTDGNHNEPECTFYAAKAHEKLGNSKKATSLYQSLIENGKKGLDENTSVDFFDPFRTVRSGNELRAESYFKIALGHLWLNKLEQAEKYYQQALQYNPTLMSLTFKKNLP